MRKSFFTALSESITEIRRVRRQEEAIVALDQRYEDALKRMDGGDPREMSRLASESLGDAWLALARAFIEKGAADNADELATLAFAQAAAARTWIHNASGYAREQYETRRFLGLGVSPVYATLLRLWKGEYISGSGREIELAWICTFGPQQLRDLESAWRWLCLAEARWGSREPPKLPTGDLRAVHEELTRRLSAKVPSRLRREGESQARAEFVATR